MVTSYVLTPEMLANIQRYVDFSEYYPICKGYSIDQKFLLLSSTGQKILARITTSDDIRVLTAKKDQFTLIRGLSSYSPLVPKALHFWFDDDSHSCIMLLTYADGEDGEQSLGIYPDEIQYAIGYQAGEELRKLHQYVAPSISPPWFDMRRKKYEWYLNEYRRMDPFFIGFDIEELDAFVRKNFYLMEGVIQTFQHDDYHPANLILNDGSLNGIIDFNRCDWGDPIHDFYKVAMFTRNISIPFSQGQIQGYFQNQIPPNFWDRYALYCAMSIVSDLVWSTQYEKRTGSDQERKKSIQRIQIMYTDHAGFSSSVPLWFKNGF